MSVGEVILIILAVLICCGVAGSLLLWFLEALASQFKD